MSQVNSEQSHLKTPGRVKKTPGTDLAVKETEQVSESTHVIASVRERQNVQTHEAATSGFPFYLVTQLFAVAIKQIASKAMTSVAKAMTGVAKATTSVAEAKTSVVKAMTSVAKAMTSVVEAMTSVAKAMTSVVKAMTSVAKAMVSVAKAMISLPKASNPLPDTNQLYKDDTESTGITWSIVMPSMRTDSVQQA